MEPRQEQSRFLRLAEAYASSRGWGWDSDKLYARYEDDENAWLISMNWDEWGESVWLTVDAETEEIREVSYRPRLANPISRETALSVAREYANRKGWPWASSVEAHRDSEVIESGDRCNVWVVDTRPRVSGGKVVVIVDAESGDVRSGHHAPY